MKSKVFKTAMRYLFGAAILFVGMYSYFVLAESPTFGERPGVCLFSFAAFIAGVVMLADFSKDEEDENR